MKCKKKIATVTIRLAVTVAMYRVTVCNTVRHSLPMRWHLSTNSHDKYRMRELRPKSFTRRYSIFGWKYQIIIYLMRVFYTRKLSKSIPISPFIYFAISHFECRCSTFDGRSFEIFFILYFFTVSLFLSFKPLKN